MDQPPKAFVSHAGEDRERFVLGFTTKLREQGVDAWLSKWEIGPGDSLVQKIFNEGIGQAQAIIVVLSRYSIDKKWVQAELNVSVVKRIEQRIKIIPVLLDDMKVPDSLVDTAWVRIRDLGNYDTELKSIVMSVFGWHDKPELGKPPAYITTITDAVPGLTKIDSLVLKLFGDVALARDSAFAISTDEIMAQAKELGVPEAEVIDALEILADRGYLKSLGERAGRPYPLDFSITLYGFEQYAKAFIPDYPSIVAAVASRIVNAGDRDSHAIRAAIEQPTLIVEHILNWLKQNGLISAFETMGHDTPIRITDVSAQLKRRLQNSQPR